MCLVINKRYLEMPLPLFDFKFSGGGKFKKNLYLHGQG